MAARPKGAHLTGIWDMCAAATCTPAEGESEGKVQLSGKGKGRADWKRKGKVKREPGRRWSWKGER